jgi:hypothetical protein
MGMLGPAGLQVANLEESHVPLVHRVDPDLHELQHLGVSFRSQTSFCAFRYLRASGACWPDDLFGILQLRMRAVGAVVRRIWTLAYPPAFTVLHQHLADSELGCAELRYNCSVQSARRTIYGWRLSDSGVDCRSVRTRDATLGVVFHRFELDHWNKHRRCHRRSH